jgi:hypothetical protein
MVDGFVKKFAGKARKPEELGVLGVRRNAASGPFYEAVICCGDG